MKEDNCASKMITREEHEKNAMIENLIWEIAKIREPKQFINPDKIQKAKASLISILNEK